MAHGQRVAVLLLLVGCSPAAPVGVEVPAERRVLGSGRATFDAAAGAVVWESAPAGTELLDSSDVLPNAGAYGCELAGWNPGTLVLSQNVMIGNRSSAAVYLAPVELRVTGITPPSVVVSVNTDLVNAGCGANGLTVAGADLDRNGTFDCIWPDDASDTADDPGWDFSQALGPDNVLGPGEYSACRFVHFNLASQTNFTFYWQVLGVVDDGWPPPPAIDPVASPTQNGAPTISGHCVTTLTAPDQLSPPPEQIPTTNEVTILGGAAPVTTICDDTVFPCQTIGTVTYCGRFSASVSLVTNATNRLEVYQLLDGVDRSNSSYVTVVHDTLPPQVASTNPPDGAVGISPAVNVVVTFSEAMQAATINSTDAATANIYLRQRGQTARLGATVTLASPTQAVLDPTDELVNNRTYEVVITTGVRDLVGLALPGQVVAAFTTSKLDDTVAPQVLGSQPTSGAVNVDRRTQVVVTFSEAMANGGSADPASPTCADTGTVTCTAIRVIAVATGLPVPATRSLSADATRVTWTVRDVGYDQSGPDPVSGGGCLSGQPSTPELDLDCAQSYRLEVSTALRDLAGNALAGAYSATFTTAVEPDATPPTVVLFSPPSGASGVSVAVQPEILFSEPLAPATVTSASIQLKEDGLSPIAATLSLSSDGLTVRIVPGALLVPDQRYVIFVNNTVTDVAGNRLAAPQNSSFFTAAAPDLTPPTVIAVAPADSAEDVPLDTQVTITFSEPLAVATVSAATVILERYRGLGLIIDGPVPGTVSLSGDRTVATFAPEQPLTAARRYRVTVTTGVTDAVGNPLATEFVSHFWAVDTDTIAPCVVGVAPVDGATDLTSNTHVAVSFSEPMALGTIVPGNVLLRASGTPVEITVTASADGTGATVIAAAPLPFGPLTLELTQALLDASPEQNALDQGSTAPGCLAPDGPPAPVFAWIVSQGADTTPPTVVSMTPANGSTNVPLNVNVVVTFSEPMDPLSISAQSTGALYDNLGNRVPTEVSLSVDARVATVNPQVLLASQTSYQATVAAGGPRDLAGNALQVGAQTSFSTLDAGSDLVPPQVVSVCPADGATGVDRLLNLPCNTAYPGQVVIVFSEPVDPDTIVPGALRLLEQNLVIFWVDRTAAVTLQPDGVTVTLTPEFVTGSGLKNATNHRVRVSTSVTDLVGNALVPAGSCSGGTGDQCTGFGT